ncbi:hypothetical protein BT69DRAFT_267656 [Atractiella rhizophila]|nr:hypothetical protein BT69DRAFT_267656 [Atractiella rhizophila]
MVAGVCASDEWTSTIARRMEGIRCIANRMLHNGRRSVTEMEGQRVREKTFLPRQPVRHGPSPPCNPVPPQHCSTSQRPDLPSLPVRSERAVRGKQEAPPRCTSLNTPSFLSPYTPANTHHPQLVQQCFCLPKRTPGRVGGRIVKVEDGADTAGRGLCLDIEEA